MVSILIRLNKISNDELKAVAKLQGKSVNSLVNLSIERHLKRTPEKTYKLGFITSLTNLQTFLSFYTKKNPDSSSIKMNELFDLIQELKKTFKKKLNNN